MKVVLKVGMMVVVKVEHQASLMVVKNLRVCKKDLSQEFLKQTVELMVVSMVVPMVDCSVRQMEQELKPKAKLTAYLMEQEKEVWIHLEVQMVSMKVDSKG